MTGAAAVDNHIGRRRLAARSPDLGVIRRRRRRSRRSYSGCGRAPSTASAQSSGVAERGMRSGLGDRHVLSIPVARPRRRHQAGRDGVDPDRAVRLGEQAVIWLSAAFVIEYAIDEPTGRTPAIDVMLTMLPSSTSRRCGIARLRQPPRAEHVHLERLAEDLIGQRVEIAVRDDRGPAGVVHQHVEVAVPLDGGVDQVRAPPPGSRCRPGRRVDSPGRLRPTPLRPPRPTTTS